MRVNRHLIFVMRIYESGLLYYDFCGVKPAFLILDPKVPVDALAF